MPTMNVSSVRTTSTDAPALRDRVAARPQMPRHVGIVLDGNRRWARANDLADVSDGHRIGFGRIPEVMGWCAEAGLEVVTLWMLSTDNIRSRAEAELDALYEIDEDVARKLAALQRYRIRFVGAAEMLPPTLVAVLRAAEAQTRHLDGMQINMGIAYGGREDLLQAVRSLVADAAATGDTAVSAERLAAHLMTAGQPDPDLIIRTSGEQRTSGFLLWQAALAEFYFSSQYWPEFSKEELHRALLTYSRRSRRFGR